MHLKMRPMSEAPDGQQLLLVSNDGLYTVFEKGINDQIGPRWIGFCLIADLLRAAEIVQAITPEGCELTGDLYGDAPITAWEEDRGGKETLIARAKVRRIAPPEEYEYKASDKPRMPERDDYELLSDGKFHLADIFHPTPGIYFRRVEVQR